MRPPTSSSELGQSTVIMVIFLASLLGMVALVIDVGGWRDQRGQMVNAADAGALAGAAYLARDPALAKTRAEQVARANGATTAVALVTSVDAPNDTITVTATDPADINFARIPPMSMRDFDIDARAAARLSSLTALTGKPLAPFAVMKDRYPDAGQTFTLKFAGGACETGNCGAVQLPAQPDCAIGTGGSDWYDMVSGQSEPCTVSVGDDLRTKAGSMTTPTCTNMAERVGGAYAPLESIVQYDADGGLAKILDPDSPQLLAVPIVSTPDGNWPGGTSATVRVEAFLFVVVENCVDGEVLARVVTANISPEEVGGTTGGATSGSGVEHIRLVSGA